MMGRTGRPNLIHCAGHRRLRMTDTKQHAPRGTAGRWPNWDRGPRAGHAGAARRCTKRHRRLWAQPGRLERAVHASGILYTCTGSGKIVCTGTYQYIPVHTSTYQYRSY